MKPNLSAIGAVLLDWAGTTIDYGSLAPTQVFIEMFRRRGIVITESEAREPMGMSKHAHIAALLHMQRIENLWRQRYGRAPTSDDADAIYAEFLPMQKQTLAQHADVIPGVVEAIDGMRARGLKIGSTTGYTRDLIELILPLAARAGYVPDVVICADDVRAGRPAPWMNFRAAELLGVYPMERVLVVDDTPVGIAAGLAAGAITVAVTKTGNAMGCSQEQVDGLPGQELQQRLSEITAQFNAVGAHYIVESVADLPELLP
jgi:phosphonoacetaldehyde hydrolase